MKTLQFKTNVNCGGCLATVTPHLNKAQGIAQWNVDTMNPAKILTVESEGIEANEVITILQEAGFQAEQI